MLDIAKQIIGSEFINICPYSATRIDIKGEEKYLFPWHQDYHYIQGSQDGLVVWMPLSEVAEGEGIELIEGSHKRGLMKVRMVDPKNSKKTASELWST